MVGLAEPSNPTSVAVNYLAVTMFELGNRSYAAFARGLSSGSGIDIVDVTDPALPSTVTVARALLAAPCPRSPTLNCSHLLTPLGHPAAQVVTEKTSNRLHLVPRRSPGERHALLPALPHAPHAGGRARQRPPRTGPPPVACRQVVTILLPLGVDDRRATPPAVVNRLR